MGFLQLLTKEVGEVTGGTVAGVYVKEGVGVGVEVVGGGATAAVVGIRAAEVVPFADADVGLSGGMNRWMAVAHSAYLLDLVATVVEGVLLTENR